MRRGNSGEEYVSQKGSLCQRVFVCVGGRDTVWVSDGTRNSAAICDNALGGV